MSLLIWSCSVVIGVSTNRNRFGLGHQNSGAGVKPPASASSRAPRNAHPQTTATARSEVTFALFGFHRTFLIVIDEAAGALGVLGEQHLPDDVGERRCARRQSTGQRVAAEGAEAYLL